MLAAVLLTIFAHKSSRWWTLYSVTSCVHVSLGHMPHVSIPDRIMSMLPSGSNQNA